MPVKSFSVKAQPVIKIDGSSTVFPVTEAVAEEFQKEMKGKVRVTVGISGTGGGFKKFMRGETDVQDASRPILTEEMESCKKNGIQYIELPICFDALTVVVNPRIGGERFLAYSAGLEPGKVDPLAVEVMRETTPAKGNPGCHPRAG